MVIQLMRVMKVQDMVIQLMRLMKVQDMVIQLMRSSPTICAEQSYRRIDGTAQL